MGAKNQNPTKSLGLPTKPKKIPRPTFNPKNSHAKFPSHKNFQKALKYYDITRKTETSALNAEKKYLLKFSYPKKCQNRKFQPCQKSFNHPCHSNSGIPPHLLNQPKPMCICIHWINQSNHSISVRFLFLFCSCGVFISRSYKNHSNIPLIILLHLYLQTT